MALDEELLAAAREEASRLEAARHEADVAQVTLAALMRRLLDGGARVEELGEALGLGQERVRRVLHAGDEPACSFCHRTQHQVGKIVAGPGRHICDRCIDAAIAVTTGDRPNDAGSPAMTPVPASQEPPRQCSFCGKARGQVAHLVTGEDARICDQCLDLCREIVAEEQADSR